MSKYEEALYSAQGYPPKQRQDQLKLLLTYPQVGVLLLRVEELRNEYVEAFSRQDLANFRGTLEHCAGSIHALTALRDELKALMERKS